VNAVESLPVDRGEVAVSIAPLHEGWQVVVQDNGCGMSDTYVRQHLFRPFRTTKDGGLGIGLYQCKAVVEAAGGTITVRSQESVGTTVSVTLPAWPETTRDGTSEEEHHGETQSAHR
jgi:signal transduction histidine kinase